MSPTMFLRIASLIALLQGVGHGLSVVRWGPSRGQEEIAVIEHMKAYAFDFQGFTRSYWDFFLGYGLMAAFNCMVEAVLFWQLSSTATSSGSRGTPIVVLFVFANLVHAILCWNYFFLTPIVLDAAIAVCLGLALIGARPQAA